MSSGPSGIGGAAGGSVSFELGQPAGATRGWRGFSLALGRALPWSLAASAQSRRAAQRRIASRSVRR